ncbi:unnamed protein product [Toxocara canis]|uniref:Uncharacterized protein n=1 Tax=Toxocara canis TaxID=6265 RepID=A0A183UCF7_TOXCA|nr:unnamed protein product [Toxocara canis]
MSWPKFDFESEHSFARKRSLTIRDAPRTSASFFSCVERSEMCRRCCVVEVDVRKEPAHHPSQNAFARPKNQKNGVKRNEVVNEKNAESFPFFDLSYRSPVLDDSFIKRAKQQEAQMTPPQLIAASVVQSPDIFACVSSPEESSSKNVASTLCRRNDLSHRTSVHKTSARRLNYGFPQPTAVVSKATRVLAETTPVVLETHPFREQRNAVVCGERNILIAQQGESEPIVSLDVSHRSSSVSGSSHLQHNNKSSSSNFLRSETSRSLSPIQLVAPAAPPSTPQRDSSTLDPFASSESRSCSTSLISTPTQSRRSLESESDLDSLFEASPVVSAKKECFDVVASEVASRASTPLKSEDADSTLSGKPEIDISREDFKDCVWLDPSERFTIASCVTETQPDASSTSPNTSVRNHVSPAKTPPHSSLKPCPSASLVTAVELDDVWERRALLAKTHRLSKLAEALRRRMQMLRSDIAMWRCDDDIRQKGAMRVHLNDNATAVHWGVYWTHGFEKSTEKKVLIADSEAINLKAPEVNGCIELYEPIVRLEGDSSEIVLLAPRYCKCLVISD